MLEMSGVARITEIQEETVMAEAPEETLMGVVLGVELMVVL